MNEFVVRDLGQVAFTVTDLERSVAFFRDQIGLPFLFSAPPGLAFFSIGPVRLMLSQPESDEPTSNSVLYLRVDDIETAMAVLKSRGTAIAHDAQMIAQMPDHELWMGFVHDPDGNLIGLMEERPLAI